MKNKRQSKILQLIEDFSINTQEDLQKYLINCGFNVTQATVSRDIRDLKLVKISLEDGTQKYSSPANTQNLSEKNLLLSLISILKDAVISVDFAMNTVVIRCHNGMAMATCAKLDNVKFPNVIGTLAGDDTIFILLKSENEAIDFMNKILIFIEK